MNYPMIMVCGASGSGKSYSIRNLNKERTKILNIEQKILPFKEALKFTNQYETNKIIDFENELNKSLDSDNFDVIVIESFTKYVELLLTQSKEINKGYEIYNYYNDKISKTLERIKRNKNKFVILLAIDERVEFINPSGAITTSRRVKVAGKQHEGQIEKEFTVVLFTDVKQEKGKETEYRFIVNNDGTSSAKSPPWLFPTAVNYAIPNDLNMVINNMKEYYELTPSVSELPTVATTLPPMNTYANK